MDLAQMLVVGGCAIIGASLGVTCWRVSQTAMFQKLLSKKKKPAVDDADDDLPAAESEEDGDASESLDEQGDEIDPLEDEVPDEFEDEPVEDEPEIEEQTGDGDGFAPDIEEVTGEEVIPVDEQISIAEGLEQEPPDINPDENTSFEEKTVLALEEIAGRLNEALERLDRLEAKVEAGNVQTSDISAVSTEIGVLAEDIEMSDLPIAAGDEDADEAFDPEQSETSHGADFSRDEPDRTSEEDPIDVATEFEPSDVPATDKQVETPDVSDEVQEFAAALEEVDPSETRADLDAHQDTEPVGEQEDPLDLPRVIGI